MSQKARVTEGKCHSRQVSQEASVRARDLRRSALFLILTIVHQSISAGGLRYHRVICNLLSNPSIPLANVSCRSANGDSAFRIDFDRHDVTSPNGGLLLAASSAFSSASSSSAFMVTSNGETFGGTDQSEGRKLKPGSRFNSHAKMNQWDE